MTLRSISSKCCLFNLQFALRRQRGEAKPSSLVAPFSRAKCKLHITTCFLCVCPRFPPHCIAQTRARLDVDVTIRTSHASADSHNLSDGNERYYRTVEIEMKRCWVNIGVFTWTHAFVLKIDQRQLLKHEKLFSQIGRARFTLSCKANFAQTRNATENTAKNTS